MITSKTSATVAALTARLSKPPSASRIVYSFRGGLNSSRISPQAHSSPSLGRPFFSPSQTTRGLTNSVQRVAAAAATSSSSPVVDSNLPYLFRTNAADHERDNQTLRTLFDAPPSSTSSSGNLSPIGLFQIPSLLAPQDFITLAQQTLARAELLVDRIVRANHLSPSDPNAIPELKKVVRNLDRLSDLLCGVIDMAELVRNAHPDPNWADAANSAYEFLCGYMNVLNTHTGLYHVLQRILSIPEVVSSLSEEALAVAHIFLRDFEKSGIHLPPAQRERFVQLSDEILVLGRGFLQDIAGNSSSDEVAESNPSSATAGTAEHDEMVDIPLDWLMDMNPSIVSTLRSNCVSESHGILRFSVADHSWAFQTILKYSPNENARKAAFVAVNCATQPQIQRLERLLKARAELATLTGASSYAEMSLGDKMAKQPKNVLEFLRALTNHHRPRASDDFDKLRKLKHLHQAKMSGRPSKTAAKSSTLFSPSTKLPPFTPWDRDLYTEQHFRTPSLRSVHPLSPYLSLGSVFAGLSRLFSHLYGIRFRAAQVAPGEVWSHGVGDVMKVEVIDEREGAKATNGSPEGLVGTIYADLWSRDGKPGGAAHYTVRCSRRVDLDDEAGDFEFGRGQDGSRLGPQDIGATAQRGVGNPLQVPTFEQRERVGSYQHPVVVLMCDFSRPGGSSNGNGPCLLAWHEVETLFHEMGHAIHSMIGRTSYHNVSGTRCATDFVELPSILMEHFVTSPQVVELMAHHHLTDAPLPYSHLVSHLQAAKSLESLDTYHQIMLARLDQLYHSPLASSFSSTEIYRQLDQEMNLSPNHHDNQDAGLFYAKGTHPQVRFGHLFGYGATYYSYLLDRVIASQIWKHVFASNPLDRNNGESFKSCCLKLGGSKDPWIMLSQLLPHHAEAFSNGTRNAMKQVGKWGIE